MARAVEHESSVGILGSVRYFTARHPALRFELAQGLEGIKHARHRGGFDVDGARRDAQLIALLALVVYRSEIFVLATRCGIVWHCQTDSQHTLCAFVHLQCWKCRCPLTLPPFAVFSSHIGDESHPTAHQHRAFRLHIGSGGWYQF